MLWAASTLVIAERVGKAVRSPAKDTLLSHAAAVTGRGRGFAVHEAMDQVGAVAGPLAVAGMLYLFGGDYGPTMALLAIPGIGVLRSAVVVAGPGARAGPLRGSSRGQSDEAHCTRTAFHLHSGSTRGSRRPPWSDSPPLQCCRSTRCPAESSAAGWVPVVYAAAMAADAVAALLTGWAYDRVGWTRACRASRAGGDGAGARVQRQPRAWSSSVLWCGVLRSAFRNPRCAPWLPTLSRRRAPCDRLRRVRGCGGCRDRGGWRADRPALFEVRHAAHRRGGRHSVGCGRRFAMAAPKRERHNMIRQFGMVPVGENAIESVNRRRGSRRTSGASPVRDGSGCRRSLAAMRRWSPWWERLTAGVTARQRLDRRHAFGGIRLRRRSAQSAVGGPRASRKATCAMWRRRLGDVVTDGGGDCRVRAAQRRWACSITSSDCPTVRSSTTRCGCCPAGDGAGRLRGGVHACGGEPGMTDAEFDADVAAVPADLRDVEGVAGALIEFVSGRVEQAQASHTTVVAAAAASDGRRWRW